jgi:hypothetical protein
MKKSELIEKINANELSSIYSKDDVIKMINGLDDEINIKEVVNKKMVAAIATDVLTMVMESREFNMMETSELVNEETIEYYIKHGNRIHIDSCEVDMDEIYRRIMNAIKSSIDEHETSFYTWMETLYKNSRPNEDE